MDGSVKVRNKNLRTTLKTTNPRINTNIQNRRAEFAHQTSLQVWKYGNL